MIIKINLQNLQLLLIILTFISSIFLNYQVYELKSFFQSLFSPKTEPAVEQPSLPIYKNSCDQPLKNDTDLIFVYMRTCPHCKGAKPIVEEYENQGKIKVYWIDVYDENCWRGKLKEFQGYVPYFECLRNNKTMTGFLDNETLEKFLNDCIKAK